jgi:hypothetical protein
MLDHVDNTTFLNVAVPKRMRTTPVEGAVIYAVDRA